MKRMKTLGLAAIAALAAMAFVGVSGASATWNSVLCKQKEHICSEANSLEHETFHLTLSNEGTGGVWTVHGLSPLFNILCLSVLLLGEGLELAEAPGQYEIHLTKLDLSNCGTNSTHTNCEIKSLKLPVLVSLLTEELENGAGTGRGRLTFLNGEKLVHCNIPLIGEIDCIYQGQGTSLSVENTGERGMVTANAVPLQKTAGSGFCSEELTITQGLLEPLPVATSEELKKEEKEGTVHYRGPLWVSS